MAQQVVVNFSQPMALFPLPGAVLLPYAIQPLHIFEPRYRAMINHVLDHSGQFAMASFAGDDWKSDYDGQPPLRPAVCVGQVVHHDSLEGGRHNILLHGLCRARITRLIEATDDTPYRRAQLEPLEDIVNEPPPMNEVRGELRTLLVGPRLSRMKSVETVLQWIDREDVTTHALLELVGFALVHDAELKYKLLEEASASRRARLIIRELNSIDQLVGRAELQNFRQWPKGMSWN